ncbi:HNH endonuclease [Mucilaginibacter dorajii]|uniref:HNH endonuclease n=1 Tax=Mucilaginibacter dorajii TaxID=692994 RepID=UPI003CD06D30
MHVHHLNQLSEIRGEHKTNPIADLCPVCPNCHAMLHKRSPAYKIEELKKIIGETKILN